MKRIRLYGYFNQNLGDDLMVRLLAARYPDIRFFSHSWQPIPRTPNLENLETLQQKYGRFNHILNILTLYKRKDFLLNAIKRRYAKECICSVYIGGSIYMQDGDAEARLRREEEKLQHGPLFVIGANIGPYRDEAFREGFEDYFRRCGGVTFRDRASFEQFQHCGNVRYAPDVVLNLKAAPEASDGSVLISVIDLAHRPELAAWQEEYEDFMARLCEACIRQGKRPVLLSFCEAQGDARAAERILEKLAPDHRARTGTLYYRGNAEEMHHAFARAERVIATRFHAMILALCYEKPVFAVCYNEKLTNVLHDLGFERFCSIPELKDMDAEGILNRCALPEGLKSYKQAAEMQFAQLDAFLKEGAPW